MRGRNAKETVASNQNLTFGTRYRGLLSTLSGPREGPLSGNLADEDLRPDRVGSSLAAFSRKTFISGPRMTRRLRMNGPTHRMVEVR